MLPMVKECKTFQRQRTHCFYKYCEVLGLSMVISHCSMITWQALLNAWDIKTQDSFCLQSVHSLVWEIHI